MFGYRNTATQTAGYFFDDVGDGRFSPGSLHGLPPIADIIEEVTGSLRNTDGQPAPGAINVIVQSAGKAKDKASNLIAKSVSFRLPTL